MSEPPVHPRRTVDVSPWMPWAYINDHGYPVRESLPLALFSAVVAPARAAILRAMER